MLQLRPTGSDAAEASTSTRQLRRAYVCPDVLREHKLVAGEWARLISSGGGGVNGDEAKEAVVQLWPRATVEDDSELLWLHVEKLGDSHSEIVMHQQHLANLSTDPVKVHPFKPADSSGIAKEITIVPAAAHPSLPTSQLPSAQREAEWTTAAVKEALGASRHSRDREAVH